MKATSVLNADNLCTFVKCCKPLTKCVKQLDKVWWCSFTICAQDEMFQFSKVRHPC